MLRSGTQERKQGFSLIELMLVVSAILVLTAISVPRVAQTNSSVSPYSQLASFPNPSSSFTWQGGGKSHMNYNSCWAAIGNNLHYMFAGSREEMY